MFAVPENLLPQEPQFGWGCSTHAPESPSPRTAVRAFLVVGLLWPALPYAASRYPHKHTQDTAPELNQSTFDAAVKAVSDLIEQYAYDPTGVLDPETVSSRHQCGHA